MSDTLVKRYHVRHAPALSARLEGQQITIKRVLAPDSLRVVRFIETSAETC